MKTVVCHFYNEEFLLPWWLKHHSKIFDHGIMIDYHSTDRSMEIIREICPTWEIRYTRNRAFENPLIDEEVMNIEKILGGWRMTLNVTEFLYGNTDHLIELHEPKQYLLGNYVFVDMENPERGQTILDHRHTLHQQRYWGYDDFANTGANLHNSMRRMNRSIHNYPVQYQPGRHYGGDNNPKSFTDLAIFYYGWANASDDGVTRKTQIHSKLGADQGPMGNHHIPNHDEVLRRLREGHQPISRDLRPEIAAILEHNRRITGQEF